MVDTLKLYKNSVYPNIVSKIGMPNHYENHNYKTPKKNHYFVCPLLHKKKKNNSNCLKT